MPEKKSNNEAVYLVSVLMMGVGGAVAWGVGGFLFAAGLWIILDLVADEIKARP